MSGTYIRLGGLALIAGLTLLVSTAAASDPPSSTITVPTALDQTVSVTWTGTILPGANAQSSCHDPSSSVADSHSVTVNVPAGAYDNATADFQFSITWDNGDNDEILTVVNGVGEEIGSSDGSSTTEAVLRENLKADTYRVLACGFAGITPQDYTGELRIHTHLPVVGTSAPAQGLQFGASVAADPQRDESEPLISIDRKGNLYTCGPTGFSQGDDYAQVSTDGGNQFHLLGTPPRGQNGIGGGGDCAWANALRPNATGGYDYAYSGLGALSGFTTGISPNGGHSIASAGFDNDGGVTSKGVGADRQWLTFVDDNTVLMTYNHVEPHSSVVIRSTDKGLTFDPTSAVSVNSSPRYPGPISYDAAHDLVYMGWDDTGSLNGNPGDFIMLSVSHDKGRTWTMCNVDFVPGDNPGFVTSDHDNAGNIYVAYADTLSYHTWVKVLRAENVSKCDGAVGAASASPNPFDPQRILVDRDSVRTTVFPWITAGGDPGRIAVAFYGTDAEGDPSLGTFKATWYVYVNESLNALSTDPANPPTFSQVKAITHPFHYDSICLNGLGCDLAVPPGDRSLADFFAIDYSPTTQKLSVVFNRGNKKPDEATGHVATPVVITQTGGPTLGGRTLTPSASDAVVRTASTDPTNDALSSYSLTAPGVVPPAPPTTNEPAADFTFVAVSSAPGGGFAVTMKVADLSTGALLGTMSRTGSQSLLWLYRFTNGFQDVTAGARWNPVQGFTFGYNEFVPGAGPCLSAAPGANDKCVVFPGDQPIEGSVDQASGTIKVTVPLYLLRALTGSTAGSSRPTEVPATAGSRLYDGQAFSMGNTLSPFQDVQSWLYPFDNTPSMDFLVPSAASSKSCASGGGSISAGKFSFDVQQPAGGDLQYRDAGSDADFVSKTITSVTCSGNKAHITGVGKNRNDDASFTADVVDNGEPGSTDTFAITLTSPAGYSRSGRLTQGNLQVR